MNITTFIMSIVMIFGTMCMQAQTHYEILPPYNVGPKASGINQVDSLGRNIGYWCHDSEKFRVYNYFQNGQANGLSRTYRKKDNGWVLFMLGLYKDGKETGQWQMFGDDGELVAIMLDFSKNTMFMEEAKKYFSHPEETRQFYTIEYSSDGRIDREGWYIYIDDIIMESWQVGDWKIYAPDGTVTIKHYD